MEKKPEHLRCQRLNRAGRIVEGLPDSACTWSLVQFARLLSDDEHKVEPETVGRWVKQGLLPRGRRKPIKFGGRDLIRLFFYAEFQELKQTRSGRKTWRDKSVGRSPVWLRLRRFPAWIKCTGDRPHPVLKALKRHRGAGLWPSLRRHLDEMENKETDRWAVLFSWVVMSMYVDGGWPKTQEDFERFLHFIGRVFYPNDYIGTDSGLRIRLTSNAFHEKLEPHYRIARAAGVHFKPMRDFR